MENRKRRQKNKVRKEKATADDLVTNKSALSLNSSVFSSDSSDDSIEDSNNYSSNSSKSSNSSSYNRPKPHLDAANLLNTISNQQSSLLINIKESASSSKDQSPAESEILRAVKTFMERKHTMRSDRKIEKRN